MAEDSNSKNTSDKDTAANVDDEVEGVWADGPYLLVRRNATLPARCIKTNRQEIVLVEETATCLHVRLLGMALFGTLAASIIPVEPAFKLVFLLIVIGMVAGSQLLNPRVRLQLPVCRAVMMRRRFLLTVGWTLFAIGMIVRVPLNQALKAAHLATAMAEQSA